MKVIETSRIALKTWEEKDFPWARKLWTDKRVTQFIAPKPFEEEEVRDHLFYLARLQKLFGFQPWAIELKENSEVVGCCGLKPWVMDKKKIELSFHLSYEHWGKGLAYEASEAVIQYAFCHLGKKELYAGHHPENLASRNLLLKLGFEKFQDFVFKGTGRLHPSYRRRR